MSVSTVVLDTNILLDLWVYDDAAVEPLREHLQAGGLRWLATPSMREELRRVLDYPHIAARLAARPQKAQVVLDAFDAHAQLQPDAPRAPYVCKDPDDQKFIELAAAIDADALVTKDKLLLKLARKTRKLALFRILSPEQWIAEWVAVSSDPMR